MPSSSLHQEIKELSAKVTALTMLVETLFVGELAKDADPATIGDAIIKSVVQGEQRARAIAGESDYILQVSETICPLIDRAVARAIAQRSKESHD